MKTKTAKIGLVGCGARKLARPAPARELYTGTLFRLSSAYAERVCDEWYVLSALHGLVRPDVVLEPYDLTLTDVSIVGRRAWAAGVLARLEALGLGKGNRWVVLASSFTYRSRWAAASLSSFWSRWLIAASFMANLCHGAE